MLNGLGLFAGIGGLELGLERSGLSRTVCFVESEPYAQGILRKHWPEVPIWDDVKTFDGSSLEGEIDIISGGFPCQDISGAGKGAGLKEGTRSGLWFEFLRIIGEVRPIFAVIENVPVLTLRGGTRVIEDLASIGYNAEWVIISAFEMGAPHLRKRIFIVAYPEGIGYGGGDHQERRIQGRELEQIKPEGGSLRDQTQGRGREGGEDVADPEGPRGGSIYQGQREEGGGAIDLDGCSQNVADSEGIAERTGLRQGQSGRFGGGRSADRGGEDVENPNGNGRDEMEQSDGGGDYCPWMLRPPEQSNEYPRGSEWWSAEPDVGRVAHGISDRVDRLKCLGNAVVPQCSEYIGRLIMEAINADQSGE